MKNWAAGQLPFPFYRGLTLEHFVPHAATLAWIVLLGQFLAGLAILIGAWTTAALLGGLFMNLNFVLAGAADPSPFYIVIQAVLLVCGAGMVLGVDGWFAARRRDRFRLGQIPSARERIRFRCFLLRCLCLPLALGATTGAVAALPYTHDFSLAGSSHDPAAILAMLGFVTAGWAIVAFLHAGQRAARLHQTVAGSPSPVLPFAAPDRRSPATHAGATLLPTLAQPIRAPGGESCEPTRLESQFVRRHS